MAKKIFALRPSLFVVPTLVGVVLCSLLFVGCSKKVELPKIEQLYLDRFSLKTGKLKANLNIVFYSDYPVTFSVRIKELNVSYENRLIGVEVGDGWHEIKAKSSNRASIPIELELFDGVNVAMTMLQRKNANVTFAGIATGKLGALTKDIEFNRQFEIDLEPLMEKSGLLKIFNFIK